MYMQVISLGCYWVFQWRIEMLLLITCSIGKECANMWRMIARAANATVYVEFLFIRILFILFDLVPDFV